MRLVGITAMMFAAALTPQLPGDRPAPNPRSTRSVVMAKNGAIASQGLKDFGTLETGKLADILVLDADPLADIHNIRKLSLVMRDGRIIDRDKLPEKPVWTKAKTKA